MFVNWLSSVVIVLGLVGCTTGATKRTNVVNGNIPAFDPDSCGDYTSIDVGRKLYAFFRAAARLKQEVQTSEAYLATTCAIMADPLGVVITNPNRNTKNSCDKVLSALRDHVRLGLKAHPGFHIDYQPASCNVDVDAAANAAAQCEGKAQAEIEARCRGTCTGTCQGVCQGKCSGTCDGSCSGPKKKDGICQGECRGSCVGDCSGICSGRCLGGCEGFAEVEADATCQTHTAVETGISAKCTEPTVKMNYQEHAVMDEEKLEAAQQAIETGLPRFLHANARLSGPLRHAAMLSAQTARKLVASQAELVGSLGTYAVCVVGQMRTAVQVMVHVQASIDAQEEVSASATASLRSSSHAFGSRSLPYASSTQ